VKNKARHEFPAPESCNKCSVSHFWNRRYGDGQELLRRKCGIANTDCTDYTEIRAPFCPLKIIPETPEGELKPCPFCGARVSMVVIGFYFAVHCRCCYKTIVIEVEPLEGEMNLLTKDEAIAAWNRREG